ncbi:MAG: GNAT N-acetyltransferase [Streptosporangiales bacterium]|nr:GNAT N-acetyltransferase [Streptosporangiales bacterium]MBO0890574.1 GNAT N-acetyltransferase [Acidothermales bacterium]
MEPAELTDGSVRLRRHRDGDLDGIVEQCTDPESRRWTTTPVPYERRHAEEFLTRAAVGWQTGDSFLAFAIADPATDEFLGTIDVRPDGTGGAEVGYGLCPSARGKGVMAAALRLVAGWALDPAQLGVEVLRWRAFVGNWASRRTAWKAGFKMEGTVRGGTVQRGVRRDDWAASLRAGEPRRPVDRWLRAEVLKGERVTLRPFRESDADACVEACTDPVTRSWLPELPDPYTPDDASAYIRSREEEHATGYGVHWCAADADDACVGSFGLTGIGRGSAEIGYWLHPKARGRGAAAEAVRLACAHAFAPEDAGGLGLARVDLRAAAGNAASRRVAERAGFTRVGRQRGHPMPDGSRQDFVTYDLVAADRSAGTG